MQANGQGLRKEVSQVLGARYEHNAELALIHTISEPVEAHVQGLAQLERHGAVGQPNRALVITIDNGGRLGVAEVGEYLPLIQGDAGCGKDASDFGLGDK